MYTIEGNKIEFFWDTDRIFDLVSYKTAIQARNMTVSKDNGEQQEMDYVITEDNREYVLEELRPVFVKLYDFFIDVAYPASNVLYVSRPDAELGVFISGFSVVCNRTVYGAVIINEQRLNSISSLCQEYAVAMVINRWCEDNRLEEFSKKNVEEIALLEKKIVKNVEYLKKRNYVNSFS